jgi:hypothetical protein
VKLIYANKNEKKIGHTEKRKSSEELRYMILEYG